MTTTEGFKAGLEDVTATTSEICFIDGHEGRLLYYGYDIGDLAEHSTFEETAFLLWNGRLPKADELEGMRRAVAESWDLPPQVLDILRLLPGDATPMEVLRTCLSSLGHYDPDSGDTSLEARRRKAVRLTARTISLMDAHHAIRRGKDPVPARRDFTLAQNLLHMMTGSPPRPEFAKAMDVALILHADHELNASTFTGRVVASTLSDLFSTVVAAIGALKGPLHGGANEQVMKILEEIGDPAKAYAWTVDALARKVKVPGFGHRVYRTEDPRATILRRYSESLGRLTGDLKWNKMSMEVERAMREHSKVFPNVDFYSASTYHSLGVPHDLFTPIFACSRIAGWIAHGLEQWAHNRLIRPRADYTGPARRGYTAVGER